MCGDVGECKPFISSRLVIARKRRALSKVALAKASAVNTKRLYTLESARAQPTENEVESIAFALKFPVSFFYRPDIETPSVGTASFRSMKSMTAGERDVALATGAIAFELSEWIDAAFELPAPDIPDLRDFPPREAATALRAYWKVGDRPIGNMVHLLEAKGARVYSLAEQCRRLDAFSLWHHDTPFVFLNTIKTAEHNRMDAAHELGHLILHRHGVPRGRDLEKDAQAFAGAFLMPEGSVRAIANRPISPTMQQLIKLKKHWCVSVSALAYRLHELGMLSDWYYRTICIQLSEYGRQREPEGIQRENSAVLMKVFAEMRKSGISKSEIARRLDIFPSDLDAMIFGLSLVNAGEGDRTPSPDADEIRRGFRAV